MAVIQGGSILHDLQEQGILMNPKANVYLVDPTDTSFTLQNAIDLCTANNGDVIACLPGGQELTAAVDFDCAGITVVSVNRGVNARAQGEYFGLYSAASYTDGPIANITANCTIIGMGFVSRDTGATFYSGAAALIGGLATAFPFGVHLKQCRFPKWNLDNRIGLAIEGTTETLIEECIFEGVGADFDSGIYVQGATQNLEIINCRFRDCTYGIVFGAFAGGGPECIIAHNHFEGSKCLSAASAATGLVADNWLMTATDTGSYNGTVNTLNGYGLQFADQHYAE